MGREAKVQKERVCRKCGEKFLVDAQGIKNHASWCEVKKVKAS